MLHKNSASPLCDWQGKNFIFLTVYLTGSGSKYIMGGIIVKYFPDCYRYDEGELNRILSVALQTRECQQIISKIKSESRETTPPQSTLSNAENESEGGTE